jgi:hypothetical protein
MVLAMVKYTNAGNNPIFRLTSLFPLSRFLLCNRSVSTVTSANGRTIFMAIVASSATTACRSIRGTRSTGKGEPHGLHPPAVQHPNLLKFVEALGQRASTAMRKGVPMQTVVPSQVVAAILRFFPGAKEPQPLQLFSGHLAQLMAIVRLVRRVPLQLFSVPIEQYIDLEIAIEVIEQTLKRSEREPLAFPMPPMGGGSPIQLIYGVLAACPDSVPASSVVNLGFITDAKTRESISLEIGSVESAMQNGEWKAATILAGSVIEALLLWRLKQFTEQDRIDAVNRYLAARTLKHRPPADLLKWTLPEMIETSAELNFLQPNTLTEVRQSKDFRNLIHPGRVLASDAECNRGTAFSAMAALDFVVTDLARP